VSSDPGLLEAHLNGGNVLQALGRFAEALAAYDRPTAKVAGGSPRSCRLHISR
jgi:hypothetical protein